MQLDDRDARAPSRVPIPVTFRAVREAVPGPEWRRIFRAGWPGWSDWIGDRVGGDPAELRRAERALRRHMPELVPVWERLVETVDGDARVAHFLTFWSPPRYLVHCAQAVLTDADGPVLIRNYDLDPALNEACLFSSAWLGRDVLGMVDGIAGLADGMNAAGLAVSLAFGGRTVAGRGFGIPLIMRYLLEVCSNVADAVDALRGLPCHMAYNLTLIDRQGRHATALLAPDRPPIVTDARAATNHQLGVEWPRHARLSRTLEREAYLLDRLQQPGVDGNALFGLFLTPPLHCRRYREGFGTVYSAMYRPADGTMQLAWPGLAPWPQSFHGFSPGVRRIIFIDEETPHERRAASAPRRGAAASVPDAATTPGPVR